MQAPMSPKFRKYLKNPENAQKLTELTLKNASNLDGFEVEIEGKIVRIQQIGYPNKKSPRNL